METCKCKTAVWVAYHVRDYLVGAGVVVVVALTVLHMPGTLGVVINAYLFIAVVVGIFYRLLAAAYKQLSKA